MTENNSEKTRLAKKPAVITAACIAAAAFVVVALFATHVICLHDWKPATCTEPEKCAVCGRTQNESLGHDLQEATCLDPQICLRCNETFASPLGHDVGEWETAHEASCSETGEKHGICQRCNQTITEEIPKIAHTEGDWNIVVDATINSDGTVTPGEKALICSVCGSEIKREQYSVEVTLSQQNALKQTRDYLTWLHPSYAYLIDWLETYDGYTHEDAVFAADYCGADWNEQAILCAKDRMSMSGASRDGLAEELRYMQFDNAQIEQALAAVGY